MQQAKLALDEEMYERNLTVIQMREIDAGVEDAAVFVFGMLNGAAAQHAHFDRIVEQRKIDCRLQRRRRLIVFGVEEFGIEQGDVADLVLFARPSPRRDRQSRSGGIRQSVPTLRAWA